MSEEPKLEHMRWLVKRRSENQECCLSLYALLKKHEDKWAKDKYSLAAQDLVGAAFSLWRAVFLVDKTGRRQKVFEHARNFLETVILDNAISYPLDKNNNEWTFNYYVSNARYRLIRLFDDWPQLVPEWEYQKRNPKKRWEYAQSILNEVVESFESHLGNTR